LTAGKALKQETKPTRSGKGGSGKVHSNQLAKVGELIQPGRSNIYTHGGSVAKDIRTLHNERKMPVRRWQQSRPADQTIGFSSFLRLFWAD